MASTQDLIKTAVERFVGEVPALARLKIVVRLELKGRGDVQVFRVEVPGPKVSKGEPDHARVEISMPRSHFNELATEGTVKHWREAFESGAIKAGGDPEVHKLIGTVIERHEARTRLPRAH